MGIKRNLFCSIFLTVIIFNALDISSVVIGSVYREDSKQACSSDLVSFTLADWLVIGGSVGIPMTTLSIFLTLFYKFYKDDSIHLVRLIHKVVAALFISAWWCVGVTILATVDSDCKEDFRRVWDVTVAALVLDGCAVLFIINLIFCYDFSTAYDSDSD